MSMVMKLQFSIYFRHNYEQVFRYLPSATMIFLDNSSKANLSYTHFHRSWKWGIRVSPLHLSVRLSIRLRTESCRLCVLNNIILAGSTS